MKTSIRSLATLGLCALSFLLSAGFGRAQLTSLVESGDTWRYLDNGSSLVAGAGSTNWTRAGFVEPTPTNPWKDGVSSFGYKVTAASGSTPFSWDSGGADTRLNFSATNNNASVSSKYITTYFRKTFNLTSATFNGFLLGLTWDDGIVVYINGTEVHRENMPAGTPSGATLAPVAVGTAPIGLTSFTKTTNPFVVGTNVVAVELHQQAASSSDVFFDLSLQGTSVTPCFGGALIGAFQDFESDFTGNSNNSGGRMSYLRIYNPNTGTYTNPKMQYDMSYARINPAGNASNSAGLDSSNFGNDTRQLWVGRDTSFNFITERLDSRNYNNIRATLELRTKWDPFVNPPQAWAASDFIRGFVQYSTDGNTFTEVPWFNYTAGVVSDLTTTLIADTSSAATPNFWMVPTISGATITGASFATPIVITTSAAHSFVTGNSVTITGVAGNTNANGTYVITVLSTTTFSLNGSAGNAAYSSGGIAELSNATTNPTDWFAFKPALWTAFNVAPAKGALTANYWRSGNLPATSVKGGLGYDNNTTIDYNPLLDAGSSNDVKTDLFNKQSRIQMRIPFTMPAGIPITSISKVELSLRFEDGVGVWLASDLNPTTRAGVKLFGDGEPATAAAEATNRDDNTALVPKTYDITTLFKANAISGASNVLCIRGYNAGRGSSDLLILPKLTITSPGVSSSPNSLAGLDLGGAMTKISTPAGLIPNGVRSVKVRLQGSLAGVSASSSTVDSYYYFDNLNTTGDPKAANDLGSALGIQLPTNAFTFEQRQPTVDADSDGIPNLLEYAFGGHAGQANRFATLGSGVIVSLTPTITSIANGKITLQFRVISGAVDRTFFDDGNGTLIVNDLEYTAQISQDNFDWLTVGKFELNGIVPNEDALGTQTATITTLIPYIGEVDRQFFRILVKNTREPWLNPPGSECPFPE